MADKSLLPRVFFDSSVLIAGSFSARGASYLLLQLAGLTLLDGRISPDVRVESERNVAKRLPAALPQLRALIDETLTEGPPIIPMAWQAAKPYADAKDVAILASALAQNCKYLVTLNEKDFWPPTQRILVIRPGELVRQLRSLLTNL